MQLDMLFLDNEERLMVGIHKQSDLERASFMPLRLLLNEGQKRSQLSFFRHTIINFQLNW